MKKVLIFVICVMTINCASRKETLKFEKVIFQTSFCYGFCPVYHLQVNSDKTFLLHNETIYKTPGKLSPEEDTLKTGYFTGKVDSKLFETLLIELKSIDSLTSGSNCCDGSTKTIIAYYNGKRKFYEAMFPPKETEKLITTLTEICEKSELVKQDNKFDIENASR